MSDEQQSETAIERYGRDGKGVKSTCAEYRGNRQVVWHVSDGGDGDVFEVNWLLLKKKR